MMDTILCASSDDAKKTITAIGINNIDDWEYLENGKVLIKLNCSVAELPDKKEGNHA